MDEQEIAANSAQIKNLNRWLMGLLAFIIIWSVGILIYVQKKADDVTPHVPVVMVDVGTGRVTNNSYANLFPKSIASNTMAHAKSAYERKEVYQVFDYVIINYFFVEGMVIERDGENYTVLYKTYDRTLQRIIVPRELLLSPSPGTIVNPASLISP